MSDPFESIRELCKVVDNAKFNNSGIFTNAILSRPEVTTLIRDALLPEQGLYKISRNSGLSSLVVRDIRSNDSSFIDLTPERIDGKTSYVAPDALQKTNNGVAIPQLVQTGDPLPEFLLSPRRRASFKLISEEVMQSEDVDVVCLALLSILEQYPSLQSNASSKDDISALRNECRTINEEIIELERKVAEQSLQLDRHNDTLNELLPRRGNFSPKKTLLTDEMIRREELEIEALERELEKRST